MALSKNLPNEFEETPKGEQISFDELEFEAEYTENENSNVYYTISGKIQEYEPTWEKYKMSDLEIGDVMEGRVEITHFIKEGRKSDSLRVRVMDDGEILDCYVNIPKPDENGFITNIRKGFDFYRTCYDFIYSVLRWKGEENVIDANGEEVNNFKRVNIIAFAKFVDQFNRIGIKVTKGNEDSDYNSFIIYKME